MYVEKTQFTSNIMDGKKVVHTNMDIRVATNINQTNVLENWKEKTTYTVKLLWRR